MKRDEYPEGYAQGFIKPKDDEQRCKYCLKVLTDGDIVYDRHDCHPALTLIQGGKR